VYGIALRLHRAAHSAKVPHTVLHTVPQSLVIPWIESPSACALVGGSVQKEASWRPRLRVPQQWR
jgi:hypothetical protein